MKNAILGLVAVAGLSTAALAGGNPVILVSQNNQLFRFSGANQAQFTLDDAIVSLSNRSNGTILAVSRNPNPAGGEAYELLNPLGTPSLNLIEGNIQPIAGPTYTEVNGGLFTLQAGNLFSVDNNFVQTLVGSHGLAGNSGFMGGSGYDPATGAFYASSQDGNLYTIDLNTSAASLVGAFGVASDNSGLEFFNGTLYAALQSFNENLTRVGTVDTATGAFNLLYTIDISNIGTGPTGVTVIIPAPGALGAFALAGAAAFRRRR